MEKHEKISVGAVAIMACSFYYVLFSLLSGDWSLNFKKKWDIYETNNKENIRRRNQYEQLWLDIFGRNGYADLNSDKSIDETEKLDAWKRMGCNLELEVVGMNFGNFEGKDLVEYGYKFPKPSLGDLEMAVESYKNE